MKRREFIRLVGGAAAVWPLAARAQQADRVRRIGYLSATDAPGEPQASSRRLIMEAALARLGYVEGSNLVIDRRLLSDQIERVNEAAAELLALQPDVIVAVNTPDVAATLSLTKSIPIVFVNPADPIASGFIASLARPGGNATGTTGLTIDLIGKRMRCPRYCAGPFTPGVHIDAEGHLSRIRQDEPNQVRRSSRDSQKPWADDRLTSNFQVTGRRRTFRVDRGRRRSGRLCRVRSSNDLGPETDR